jgi:hypothetical protein
MSTATAATRPKRDRYVQGYSRMHIVRIMLDPLRGDVQTLCGERMIMCDLFALVKSPERSNGVCKSCKSIRSNNPL